MLNSTGKQFAVEMVGINKYFANVQVLWDVSLSVNPGEVLALVGENGAGKSTLMKILAGIYPQGSFSGQIKVYDEQVSLTSVKDAERAGIITVYQELSLVPELSVAENLFLGSLPNRNALVEWKELNTKSSEMLECLGIKINPELPVKALSVGWQQLVAIGRALVKQPKILILDEPTAALPEAEVLMLFALLRSLKAQGVTCIYISHRMPEIFEIADRVTILRDGRTVGTENTTMLNHRKIVSMMVGRDLTDMYPKRRSCSEVPNLQVHNLTVPHPIFPHRKLLNNISFTACKGEILGVAGLMGAGRTELLEAIYGGLKYKGSGKVIVDQRELVNHGPAQAIEAGLSLVTEERKRDGLVLGMSVRENISLPSLKTISNRQILDFLKERKLASEYIDRFGIKTPSMEQVVNRLSGGNQQKVILAKWLATNPKVLLLDEPTRGIDVGSKADIYQWIVDLASKGITVVMVSSELPEILGLCHRIIVMHEGEISGILDHGDATEESIMMLAIGEAQSA